LVYYGRFTYTEAQSLPINLRRFFLDEIVKEVKKQNGKEEAEDKPLTDQEKMMMRSKLNQAIPEAQKYHSQEAPKKAPDIRNLKNSERTKHMSFEGP
jgi:hypothetical protein